jgi:hypothetical protein
MSAGPKAEQGKRQQAKNLALAWDPERHRFYKP